MLINLFGKSNNHNCITNSMGENALTFFAGEYIISLSVHASDVIAFCLYLIKKCERRSYVLFFSDLTSLTGFLVAFRSINVFDWLIKKKETFSLVN